MASNILLSMTAFSIAISFASAEQFFVSNDGDKVELVEESSDLIAEEKSEKDRTDAAESTASTPSSKSDRRLVFPQKNVGQSSIAEKGSSKNATEQKKIKPHYAGVRRPQPKSAVEGKKKSSKIKNQWFSSKTHPKVEKKEVVEEETVVMTAELPADRPFYIGKTQSTAQASSSIPSLNGGRTMHANNAAQIKTGPVYPKTGFQAPSGHVYLTAEYLLWRTRQEGMEFATAKRINFEFNSGFRVGLGVHLPYDGWDVYINYTNFHPVHSHHVHGSFYPLFLFEGAGSQGPSVSGAHAHWEIELQNVDVDIGRAYYIAKTLTFRPFVGLKGAWIKQHAKIGYEGGFIPLGQTFRTHFKNDFKGAGPLIGIESNWQIGAGFSLFGDLAAALIVGHFDNEQQQHQINDAEVVHLDSTFNLVSPFLQMIAGLAWDRNFNRDQCHVGLSAGFETQYWWGQNQTEQFTDKDFPIYVREKGDLAFYGLTLRGRFDF